MAKNGPQEHDEKQKFRGRWDLIHGHHDFERLEKLIPFTSFFLIYIYPRFRSWMAIFKNIFENGLISDKQMITLVRGEIREQEIQSNVRLISDLREIQNASNGKK